MDDFFAFPFMCCAFSINILLVVLWIAMLLDVVKRDFSNPNEKIIWVIVIALTGFIGAGIYYFMIKLPDRK